MLLSVTAESCRCLAAACVCVCLTTKHKTRVLKTTSRFDQILFILTKMMLMMNKVNSKKLNINIKIWLCSWKVYSLLRILKFYINCEIYGCDKGLSSRRINKKDYALKWVVINCLETITTKKQKARKKLKLFQIKLYIAVASRS